MQSFRLGERAWPPACRVLGGLVATTLIMWSRRSARESQRPHLDEQEGVLVAKRQRLRSGFTLGGEQAEADPLLEDAFYASSDYEVLSSHQDTRCFVVGRTGAGKSAALQHLEETQGDHVIRINPEDLSLPYITDLQVIRYLDELDVNLDLFWIALWKHVLLVEIIRHRYQVDSPAAKQNFMRQLKERVGRNPGKAAALEYLEEFEGRFWCETDERVRDITDKFTQRLGSGVEATAAGGPFKAGGKVSADTETTSQTRREEADRFQRIVNETQLSKLNKMIEVLNEDILDGQHFTYVVIDDLDRDWVDERLANDLIRCLFRTVLDLKRVKNLKVLVALRTNIFQELEFGRRSGGQEEKFRSMVLPVQWTRSDLEQLLDERVRVAAPRFNLELSAVADLLPHANRARGNPLDYLLERTLLRPRDAIAFLNECLSRGIGKSRLSWDDIQNSEHAYSANRLLALRDEWKPTYPGIDQVLDRFRGASARIDRADLEARLDEVMMLPADPAFPGVRWLTDASSRMWSGGDASADEIYQPLATLLYTIGFLGIATKTKAAPIFCQDDPLALSSPSAMASAEYFFVHRTYQAGLEIKPARET